MHDNSIKLYTEYALPFVRGRVLEIGPDKLLRSTLQELSADRYAIWDTLDIDGREWLTYNSTDLYRYPIEDEAYSTIVAAQVLEHVPMPWLWFQELGRIVAKGGHVITIAPVNWPYHPHPVDCWRVYPHAMLALHGHAGLKSVLALAKGDEVVDTIAIARKGYA